MNLTHLGPIRPGTAPVRAASTQTLQPQAPARGDVFEPHGTSSSNLGIDPAFLPTDFDMGAAVSAMRKLLLAQNPDLTEEMLRPGQVSRTWATDFDGTLGRSANIPVLLRANADVVSDGKTLMKKGDLFRDPMTHEPLMLHALTGTDVAQDLKALQAKYPQLPWTAANGDGTTRSLVQQDFSAFDDPVEAMQTPLESSLVRDLQGSANSRDKLASFVITSRTNSAVADGIHAALKARDADVWGVITCGDPKVQAALGVADPNISDGQRKAIIQMILLSMLNPAAHSWRDDSRGNTGRAIESLAAKFPGMDISVFDANHVPGQNHSEMQLVARSDGHGGFVDPRDGGEWTQQRLAAHDAEPLPLLPQLTLQDIAGESESFVGSPDPVLWK